MTLPQTNFQLPSAKNLSLQKVVQSFVPTALYWEMLASDSHDVVFGTRGSGKTMLLRMMSAQHLLPFSSVNPRAKEMLFDKRRFGVFLPLGIDWCVAFLDPNGNAMPERYFIDGVNLVAADMFLDTLETIILNNVLPNVDASLSERTIAEDLSTLWFRRAVGPFSFLSLRRALLNHQAILRDLWRTGTMPSGQQEEDAGYFFRSTALFDPVNGGVKITNRSLGLHSDHRWVLCLDELEDLKPNQIRAIVTVLRGSVSHLVLKITTQPYTLDVAETTFAKEATAVDFRDYQSKRLQYDPADPEYQQLVAEILRKYIGNDADPRSVFGNTTFVERASEVSRQFLEVTQANSKDAEARKGLPAGAIRVLKRDAHGHRRSRAYSGWTTLVRISDGNPGVFVRLLNVLKISHETKTVDPADQHDAVEDLATAWHEWSQALYRDGAVLFKLIENLGTNLAERLHAKDVDDTRKQVASGSTCRAWAPRWWRLLRSGRGMGFWSPRLGAPRTDTPWA
jgi:hypothetical protein